MTREEFLRAAGSHGPCVGLLLTPAPSAPPDGVEFRSVDARHIPNLETSARNRSKWQRLAVALVESAAGLATPFGYDNHNDCTPY